MRIRIVCLDFGRTAPGLWGLKRYVIEYKPHWWSRWRIRDWENRYLPTFYESEEETKNIYNERDKDKVR